MATPDSNNKDRQHVVYWALLCALSLVNLTSLTNSFVVLSDNRSLDWESQQRWMVSVACISFSFSLLSILAHLFTTWFAGTLIEIGTAFVVLIFWCADIPTLIDNDFISVTSDGGIIHSNAFFSAWGSFFFALLLLISHAQLKFERTSHATWFHWAIFTVSSLVAMASAIVSWGDADCESTDDSDMCSRTMFGIVLGAMSTIIGIGLVFQTSPEAEHWVSVLLFALWCFGIAYLTFNEGPALYLGHFYFSTWICMLISLSVSAMSVYDLIKDRDTPTTPPTTTTTTTTDKNPVALLDITILDITKDVVDGGDLEEEEVA